MAIGRWDMCTRAVIDVKIFMRIIEPILSIPLLVTHSFVKVTAASSRSKRTMAILAALSSDQVETLYFCWMHTLDYARTAILILFLPCWTFLNTIYANSFKLVIIVNHRTELNQVPMGSSSRGGDVTGYVWHKPAELAHSFLFCSCVYFCLCGRFNCISFHKFSRQLSVSSLCSCGLSSVLLVLWTLYLFMKVYLSPDMIAKGLLGSKHQLGN